MPAPKRAQYSDIYHEVKERGQEAGECKDCSVVAVAIACGVDYEVAREALAAEGRQERTGVYTGQILRAVKRLGKDCKEVASTDFIYQYPGVHSKLKSVTTHHPDRFKKVWENGKTYLLMTSRHVLTVQNGVNHDWTRGSSKRVQEIYEVF